MPNVKGQTRGVCGHTKSREDTHESCLSCTGCLFTNTCHVCEFWTEEVWLQLTQRRTHRSRKRRVDPRVPSSAVSSAESDISSVSSRREGSLAPPPVSSPDFIAQVSDTGTVSVNTPVLETVSIGAPPGIAIDPRASDPQLYGLRPSLTGEVNSVHLTPPVTVSPVTGSGSISAGQLLTGRSPVIF